MRARLLAKHGVGAWMDELTLPAPSPPDARTDFLSPPVNTCPNCSQPYEAGAAFCVHCGSRDLRHVYGADSSGIDAGSPLARPTDPSSTHPRLRLSTPSHVRATRMVPCPHCGRAVDRTALFCPHCGLRTGTPSSVETSCSVCGETVRTAGSRFCGHCGAQLSVSIEDAPGTVRTHSRAKTTPPGSPVIPRLQLLDDAGDVTREIPLEREVTVIGRSPADVHFDEDSTMATEHAVISREKDGLRIRDLSGRQGGATWFFLRESKKLEDGDLMLLGSQVIRFRRLPGDDAESARSTQAGSRVPLKDVAVLEQILPDGRIRDVCHVPLGRAILIGREHGNWVFPYDPTMSGRHAEVRSRPDSSDVVVRDLGSRNGVGVILRNERALHDGDRVLLGRQLLRIDFQ